MSLHIYRYHIPNVPTSLLLSACNYNVQHPNINKTQLIIQHPQRPARRRRASQLVMLPQLRPNRSRSSPLATATAAAAGVPLPPLDLTEDNFRQVLADARAELGQIFDTSVGITGQIDLAELDGPFVKISLKGRFWHKRSTVLARIGNYLKQRIPEILEVDIEDETQLDDSPENF